jgi:hypothetical protein
MAKRGRPKKKVDIEEKEIQNDIETTNEELVDEPTNEQMTETIPETEEKSVDSDLVGQGTNPNYNPFAESVVERDYSTPEVASGVIDEIDEPQFVPPSYEDIIADQNGGGGEFGVEEDTGSPFDNPNPALNDLDTKDKKIACESLVDTCLDGYEQLHKYAQYIVKVDEDELLQRHQQGKIDLTETIPVDENGNTMSVSEFVGQYNQQSVEALQYDKEFGYKVRPAMVRVFMKKGWGMTDEQFLLYHFGKDIAIKVGIMFQLKKTINTTLQTLEKAHKRNVEQGYASATPPPVQDERVEQEEEIDDFDMEDDIIETEEVVELSPLTPEEDFEDKTQSYNENLDINMPEKRGATKLPKEVRDDIQKPDIDE